MNDQGVLITGCITIVLVLAQLKLFSIAKTLKEILEELKETRRTLYALTTKLAPAAIAPEGTRVDQEKKEFLELSDRLAATQDPEEQRRLQEELVRKAVGR